MELNLTFEEAIFAIKLQIYHLTKQRLKATPKAVACNLDGLLTLNEIKSFWSRAIEPTFEKQPQKSTRKRVTHSNCIMYVKSNQPCLN